MIATLVIDEKLLDRAREITGLSDDAAIIDRALAEFVHRDACRRFAEMGGSCPDLEPPSRRRAND